MSFTKKLVLAAAAALPLAGCVQAPGHMQPDYGYAVRQNLAAQVADPDAAYARKTAPASSGPRAALAQQKYVKGQVTQPAAQGTGAAASGPGPAGAPPAPGRN